MLTGRKSACCVYNVSSLKEDTKEREEIIRGQCGEHENADEFFSGIYHSTDRNMKLCF